VSSDIDFTRIESNEHGVHVLEGHQVDIKNGKKQARVVTLVHPVSFFPDVLDIEAELFPDGSGFFLKVPSLPSPLWKFPDKLLNGMAAAHDESGGSPGRKKTPICKSTKQSHKTEATRIATSEADKSKVIAVGFPKETTCNNSQFNDDAEGQMLVKRIVTFTATHPAFQKDGVCLEFPFSCAFWRIVVNGSEKLAEPPAAPDYSAQVAKMINGVGSLHLGKLDESSRTLSVAHFCCFVCVVSS